TEIWFVVPELTNAFELSGSTVICSGCGAPKLLQAMPATRRRAKTLCHHRGWTPRWFFHPESCEQSRVSAPRGRGQSACAKRNQWPPPHSHPTQPRKRAARRVKNPAHTALRPPGCEQGFDSFLRRAPRRTLPPSSTPRSHFALDARARRSAPAQRTMPQPVKVSRGPRRSACRRRCCRRRPSDEARGAGRKAAARLRLHASQFRLELQPRESDDCLTAGSSRLN